MRRYKIKKICFASSSAVYGELPGRISESAGPMRPQSHYGAAKLASEAFISSFAENYGFTSWIMRFPNVVGERATHGVIYDFIKKLKTNPAKLEILGNGKQKKPYMYIGDLIKAILHITRSAKESRNFYNVGVKGVTSVDFIAKQTAAAMGLSPEFVHTGGRGGWPGDIPAFAYNYSKLLRTGWKPEFNSDQAVRYALKKMLNKS
jgi:UDP-glucose 4-epimerase